jgi:hypothetical protein
MPLSQGNGGALPRYLYIQLHFIRVKLARDLINVPPERQAL